MNLWLPCDAGASGLGVFVMALHAVLHDSPQACPPENESDDLSRFVGPQAGEVDQKHCVPRTESDHGRRQMTLPHADCGRMLHAHLSCALPAPVHWPSSSCPAPAPHSSCCRPQPAMVWQPTTPQPCPVLQVTQQQRSPRRSGRETTAQRRLRLLRHTTRVSSGNTVPLLSVPATMLLETVARRGRKTLNQTTTARSRARRLAKPRFVLPDVTVPERTGGDAVVLQQLPHFPVCCKVSDRVGDEVLRTRPRRRCHGE